jgi:hypothetical protein
MSSRGRSLRVMDLNAYFRPLGSGIILRGIKGAPLRGSFHRSFLSIQDSQTYCTKGIETILYKRANNQPSLPIESGLYFKAQRFKTLVPKHNLDKSFLKLGRTSMA